MEKVMERMRPISDKEDHSDAEVTMIESLIHEIQMIEEQLNKSWNMVRSFLTTTDEMTKLNEAVLKTKSIVMSTRTKGRLIINQGKVKEESVERENMVTDKSTKVLRLQKMKPPTFSGKIREFARFLREEG